MSVKVGLKYIEIWKESMEDKVLSYEAENAERGQIVLYGPSNFTRWSEEFGHKNARDVLLGKSGKKCVINRGFGSSCPEHHLYYYPRLIRPLEPKVLVYACYGNSSAFGYSSEEAWELAQRVIAYAKTDFPDIKIYICGPARKPVPNLSEEMDVKRFTGWAKQFCKDTENCYYIDVYAHEELGAPDLFVEDNVHFNQKGYDLYEKVIREGIRDELDKF